MEIDIDDPSFLENIRKEVYNIAMESLLKTASLISTHLYVASYHLAVMQRKYQRIRIEQPSHVQYPQRPDIIECVTVMIKNTTNFILSFLKN